ncbi:MAG: [FeFe] hydrogenase H-cluster maturation GTPase HydF [Lachnospiraceae bacterium]|nr:[FeFe] hydrogenase H-cluster maturation GTPase HydF [Lachnospiraceae bacterium]
MTLSLNETPSANRLHIGVFGKTNSGKSSFINAFTGQNVSIVSEISGTTTDPIYKPMEINSLGACVIIDTAGFDDNTALGDMRMEKTKLAVEKTELAVILLTDENVEDEIVWYEMFKERKIPVLFLISKADTKTQNDINVISSAIQERTKETPLVISAITKEGLPQVKDALARRLPENYGSLEITGNLVTKEDLVLLVMPQDIQAPKGRLILPQVQTIRELLDKKCMVMSVTSDCMEQALQALKQPPKLIITDSQIFGFVYEHKPKESMLTSFSVLFAAYKGDLSYYLEGAKAIDSLTEQSRILIAECCTHAPLTEDIGRVKIPNMLRKRFGAGLTVDIVSGTDYPEDLTSYDLIIQCGACMFNRQYVLSRIDRAKKQCVPMTNYGVTIAHITGILDKIFA